MTITVSTADPRSLKALALLEGADRWQKGHPKDGRSFYAARPELRTADLFALAERMEVWVTR